MILGPPHFIPDCANIMGDQVHLTRARVVCREDGTSPQLESLILQIAATVVSFLPNRCMAIGIVLANPDQHWS